MSTFWFTPCASRHANLTHGSALDGGSTSDAVAASLAIPARVEVLSDDSDLLVLENGEVQLVENVPLGESPMCNLPPRSFKFETGASQGSFPCLIVSGHRGECRNGYLEARGGVEHVPPESSKTVKFSDDEVGRMDALLDELCRERSLVEEEYYDVSLPQIMRPRDELLDEAASEKELEFMCGFFVSVQTSMLRTIARTLARSFHYHVDALMQEAQEALDRSEKAGGDAISLRTLLKHTNTLNPYQKRRRRAFLDAIKCIAEILHRGGRLMNPSSYRAHEIDLSRCSMDDKKAHAYLKTEQRKSGGGTKTKCGVTYTGDARLEFYSKEYQEETEKAAKRGREPRAPPQIISVVSIDNLPLRVEREISAVALDVFKEFGCPSRPRTAKQLVMFECFSGLPAGTGLLFRSLTCTEDECSEGGAMNIIGMFKRTLLHVIESAVSIYLTEVRGMKISGQVHELVAPNMTLAVGLVMARSCAEAVGAQVDFETDETQVRMKEGEARTSLISTWAPKIKEGNENHVLISPLIHGKCVGDNWTDTCVPVQCKDPKNGADMYGTLLKNSGFTFQQLSDSCDKKDALLRAFTLEGGGAVIVDRARQCMTAREKRDMVEYIQSEFTGSGGERYKIRMSYLDCTVLAMDHPDGKLRRVYVVGCPGFMADTNPYRSHGDETLTSMFRRTCSWQVCHDSSLALSTAGACPTDFRTTWMDEPIENSLVINWMLSFAHDGLFVKISIRRNALTFKNRIAGEDLNVYAQGYNGYRLPETVGGPTFGDYNRRLVGRLKNDRELTEVEDENLQFSVPTPVNDDDDDDSVRSDKGWDDDDIDPDVKKEIDRKFMIGATSCMTHSSPGNEASHEEALSLTLNYIETGREGRKLSRKAIYWRWKTFFGSGWVTGKNLADLKAYKKKHQNNGGNTSGNHHSASAADTKVRRATTSEKKKDRTKFIIQGAGNSKAPNRTWSNGDPWNPDAIPDGATATFSHRFKPTNQYPNGKLKTGSCTWRKEMYVPGTTFETLYDEARREGKYKLCYDRNSVHLDSSGHRPEVVNTHNFVIVWYEEKKAKKKNGKKKKKK